jgi:hypothetical protein
MNRPGERNGAHHEESTPRPNGQQGRTETESREMEDQRSVPRETPVFHEPTVSEVRDESDWDSEELLDEGLRGNENAVEERVGGSAGGGRFEQEGANERQGGHGYGSFEEEGSPQSR